MLPVESMVWIDHDAPAHLAYLNQAFHHRSSLCKDYRWNQAQETSTSSAGASTATATGASAAENEPPAKLGSDDIEWTSIREPVTLQGPDGRGVD